MLSNISAVGCVCVRGENTDYQRDPGTDCAPGGKTVLDFRVADLPLHRHSSGDPGAAGGVGGLCSLNRCPALSQSGQAGQALSGGAAALANMNGGLQQTSREEEFCSVSLSADIEKLKNCLCSLSL